MSRFLGKIQGQHAGIFLILRAIHRIPDFVRSLCGQRQFGFIRQRPFHFGKPDGGNRLARFRQRIGKALNADVGDIKNVIVQRACDILPYPFTENVALSAVPHILRHIIRIIFRLQTPFNGKRRCKLRIYKIHHNAEPFTFVQLHRLIQLDGVISGIRLYSGLFFQHQLAGFWLSLFYASINRYGIFCTSICSVEGHRFQHLIAFRCKNIRACRFCSFFGIMIYRHGIRPSHRVVLIVFCVIIVFFKRKGVAVKNCFILIGKPEIAVVTPVSSPTVANKPRAVILRLVSLKEVFFWVIVVPTDDHNNMVNGIILAVIPSRGFLVICSLIRLVENSDRAGIHYNLFGNVV